MCNFIRRQRIKEGFHLMMAYLRKMREIKHNNSRSPLHIAQSIDRYHVSLVCTSKLTIYPNH